MPRPMSLAERQALEAAELLVRYAAENSRELPRATVGTICSAFDARDAGAWDESQATEFWCAFNSLCELVKPATVDSLRTTLINQEASGVLARWLSRRPEAVARRYLLLLICMLCLSVALLYLVTTAPSLSDDVQKLVRQNEELTTKLRGETEQLEAALGSRDFREVGSTHQSAIESIQADLKQQDRLTTQMLQRHLMMTHLLAFGLGNSLELGNAADAHNLNDVRSAMRNIDVLRAQVDGDRLKAQILIGAITSMVLPILLGLMGACTYVVRLISDQIRESTFSTTSPIRHLVRVALGGLAGVVIGFGGVVEKSGVSSAALAFIAGYAVEPVFSTLDSIAEKFRR